jgi:hypothetical protein
MNILMKLLIIRIKFIAFYYIMILRILLIFKIKSKRC